MKLFADQSKRLFDGRLDTDHYFNVYYQIDTSTFVRTVYCKESFVRMMFLDEYRRKALPDFTFYSKQHKIQEFIQVMNVVHKFWNLPRFTYRIFTNSNGLSQIHVRNTFWRKNPAHLDLLATLFKSIATYSRKITIKDIENQTLSQVLVAANGGAGNSYLPAEVLEILDFGPGFVLEYYGLDSSEHKTIERKMFNYSVNGLISSLRKIIKARCAA